MTGRGPVAFRHPTEDDHRRIVDVVDEWAGGRRVHDALSRTWVRHFAGTSFAAEGMDGRLLGFLVGFVSQEHPEEAVVIGLGVHPSSRRQGIGRGLVDRFAEEATTRGASRVVCAVWPGDPILLAFLRGLGFTVDDGAGTQNRYGTASYPDYESEREDRAIFSLPLG